MKVLIVSPYHGGSHKAWAEGFRQFSQHEIDLLTLPARFWKWRMHGGAVTLARRFLEGELKPDLLLATDMLDFSTFLALTRQCTGHTPAVLYMHENQLTYPLPDDGMTGPMRRQLGERDRHYAFVNFASMLAADRVFFNSRHHLDSFFDALPNFLKHFPEYNELNSIGKLHIKSEVVPVGIDLRRFDSGEQEVNREAGGEPPLVLWNQRWEYDKNPADFFAALTILAAEGHPFQVALCGQQYGKQPAIFAEGQARLGERVVHAGYASVEQYARLLWQADITVSTAWHEFFGISLVEAIYTRTFPLLPARLSYPEIIPDRYHPICLYADQNELVNRLRWALTHLEQVRMETTALAAAVSRYDWRVMAPRYDALLDTAANLFV